MIKRGISAGKIMIVTLVSLSMISSPVLAGSVGKDKPGKMEKKVRKSKKLKKMDEADTGSLVLAGITV